MEIFEIIEEKVKEGLNSVFKITPEEKIIQIQKTRKEFEGDVTVVVFPLTKITKKSPEETGKILGDYLIQNTNFIEKYNIIKGFLNLSVTNRYYIDFFYKIIGDEKFGFVPENSKSQTIMVEYSSPNTNKPLHLGHIRNNLLGHSICEILKANGYRVIKTNLVNDRGIHICKSMLAWKKWYYGITPEQAGKKGDHFVGDMYVLFEKHYKEQVKELMQQGFTEEEALRKAPIIQEALEMLRKWEAGDKETVEIWKMMNSWVYEGFEETYKKLGITFDKIYYESDTYLIGKKVVYEGLEKGIFQKDPDGSIWIDLTDEGLDRKLLLRSDGTSVYITQDIGTAQIRQQEFSPDKMIYVVGNEQNYHFKVLSIILDRLGYPWAKTLYHLSYGMVELPEGKMKSREGKVVDADDLIEEMITTAEKMSNELGKLEGLDEEEKKNIYRIIGLGALKYFILKVDPVKNMIFNPQESIDFNGHTGPFIQYTYARIRSIFRKAKESNIEYDINNVKNENIVITPQERDILKLISEFPDIIKISCEEYNPANLANYLYILAREYNQFYQEIPILKAEDPDLRNFRLGLSKKTGEIIKNGLSLLGIEVPERM